ncbi:MAG: DUF1552 domain-containing protein, partial [Rhodopirellula bahusiensis]
MKRTNLHSRSPLKRRTLLRGSGVAMGLPFLSAMRQSFAGSDSNEDSGRAKRFVAMTVGLGLLPENLVPEGEGMSYQPSRYLQSVQDLRDNVTVVSGSSH